MDCEKCRELLGEILLGPGSNDPAVLCGEFDKHLASCYSCQAECADLKVLREKLLPLKQSFQKSFPPVTDAQVEALKRMVRAKVRVVEEGRKKKSFWIGRQSAFSFVACFAVVAVALLSCGIYLTSFDDQTYVAHQHEPTPIITATAEIVCPEPIAIKSAEEAKSALLVEYESYLQLGDGPNAFAAFLEYAESFPEKEMLSILRKEGDKYFYRKDFGMAMRFFETIIYRAKDGFEYDHAQLKIGQFHAQSRNLGEASAVFDRLLENSGNEWVIRIAFREKSQILLRTGDLEAALKVLEDGANRLGAEDDYAYALLLAGQLYEGKGETYYVKALIKFQRLVNEYPHNRYADSARGMIRLIKARLSMPPAI